VRHTPLPKYMLRVKLHAMLLQQRRKPALRGGAAHALPKYLARHYRFAAKDRADFLSGDIGKNTVSIGSAEHLLSGDENGERIHHVQRYPARI